MTSMLPNISEGFTVASFRGRYGIARVCHGGHVQTAGIGVFEFDGNGRWTGSLTNNVPGPVFGQRLQVPGTLEGTYTVEENGSGYGSIEGIMTLAGQKMPERTATFLVTRAERVDGVTLAQELWFMEDPVDPVSGGIHTIQACRHPNEGEFSFASFKGSYAGPGIGTGGQAPAAAVGLGAVNFDGNGGFVGVDMQNLPGNAFGERRNATFDTPSAHYTINPDGTGMIIAPGGQAHLVVLRAKVVDGIREVLEYFFVTNDLHPPTGNLVLTTVTKRLP